MYNTIQRHASNTEGNFFLASDKFIGRNPPTFQELQRQLELKNTQYINMLRYFARNIKGNDNYWCARTDDLEQWINHHVGKGHGPSTFFHNIIRGSGIKISEKKLLQMPFLELYHVYIYYMTSHVQFG